MGSFWSTPQEGCVLPTPVPVAAYEICSPQKGGTSRSFEEQLGLVGVDLCSLEREVIALEQRHAHYEGNATTLPPESTETEEEKAARHNTERKECIRLEELLTRVQISLDGTPLPRLLDPETGESIANPLDRMARKQAVQDAETLIKRAHDIRTSLPAAKL